MSAPLTTSPGPTDDTVLTPQLCLQGREQAQPVIDWLLSVRLKQTPITLLFDGFLRQLNAVGIPVDRSTLHLPQLHPQLRARTVLWEGEAGGAMEIPRAHGIEVTDYFLDSPIRLIFEGGPVVRRRLGHPDCPADFPITRDLKAQGYSDYTARPLPFSTGRTNSLTLATKHPEGFSGLDIATVEAAMPVFGTLLELRNAYRTSKTLMETYVGQRSGQRVLAGTIKRGDVERINAVLWTSDLRDFTGLSETLPMEEVIVLLDEYFEAMAEAIEANGGEILKFIGDAILAIFPIEEKHAGDPCRACMASMVAAQAALKNAERLREERRAAGKAEFRCGIALHVGDVMYGNIGAADRLDFTVIGPAVNLVSRIEALNQDLAVPLVYSAAYAEHWTGQSRSLGVHKLKGIAEPQEVFTLEDTSGLPCQD
ncbi:adenylate/guanylate cyclase domain-containing protein [Pelagibius marinus]|uniref:adenylate/guanylate cyclase domain-containing protein n=1 Tax=Pelagibius marinus TaxID=2762760 RepID=UPI001872DA9A|nr:adenylate/guanylate cyclase domain-containing protein [Pelagibius marinus]